MSGRAGRSALAAGVWMLLGAVAIADPAAAPAGSAAAVLGPWLRLYATWEVDLSADLAEGEATPTRTHGAASFAPGQVGRALRLGIRGGGAQIEYAGSGNIDFSRPGALSFWISPRGWRDATPAGESGYVRFVRVPGSGRSVFVVERDVRRGGEEGLIVGFFDLPGGEKHFLSLRPGARWGPDDWHLIAVAWDAAGFEVSVDGGSLVRKAVPQGRIEASFTGRDAASVILVGDATREFSLLDDFAVYSRGLRDGDVAGLWSRGRER